MDVRPRLSAWAASFTEVAIGSNVRLLSRSDKSVRGGLLEKNRPSMVGKSREFEG